MGFGITSYLRPKSTKPRQPAKPSTAALAKLIKAHIGPDYGRSA